MKTSLIACTLLLTACPGPPSDEQPGPSSGAPPRTAPVVDEAAPGVIRAPDDPSTAVAEGTPGEFDPDACAPYTARALDGSPLATRQCTGVYYGGQQNLGQCLNGVCYNELSITLPTTFVKGTKVPAIVYIHGGGWATGSYKEANLGQQEDYLQRGFAVIGLNYRLSPQNTDGAGQGLDPTKNDPDYWVTMKSGRWDGAHPYATALADVKTAVQYIRSNMSTTIDGDSLIAMGHSAGGHLAVMLGVTGSDANDNADPNLRGRRGSHSTRVRAVVVKDPALDFGLFVGDRDSLPQCGELLTPENQAANLCGYTTHPAPPAAWSSATLGNGLVDLCVDKKGPDNALPFATWGTNYFDESNPWSSTMMGGDPLVVAPTPTASYFQWLVTPKSFLDATSAPIYIINGVCDAEVPARGARDLGDYASTSLGLSALRFTVVLPQGGGHNDALNEKINPGGNQAVRQWLSDNGLALSVAP
jgi:hypothetical protein